MHGKRFDLEQRRRFGTNLTRRDYFRMNLFHHDAPFEVADN